MVNTWFKIINLVSAYEWPKVTKKGFNLKVDFMTTIIKLLSKNNMLFFR